MSSTPWVKFFPSDFLAGIGGLEPDEIAAYSVILMMIYDRQGPIAEDVPALSWRLRMRPGRCQKAIDSLVQRGKIRRDQGGLLWNERATKEIENRTRKSQVNAESAHTRWQSGDKNTNENNKRTMRTHSERYAIPEARSQKPEREEEISPSTPLFEVTGKHLALVPVAPQKPSSKEDNPDFELWWKQYPRRADKGSARKAYERVVKAGKASPKQLMTGALRYAAERQHQDPKFTKHAATWLNAEAWGNEPDIGGNRAAAPKSRADSAIDGIMSYFNERTPHE